jgi:hypothetical protein
LFGAANPADLLAARQQLLQPGARYFRLADAFQVLDGNNMQTNQTVAALQAQVTSLQNQINTINQRLANAGIA